MFWQLEHFGNNSAGFAAKKLSMRSMPVDAFLSFCLKKKAAKASFMFQLSHLSNKYSANIGWRGSGCEDQNLDLLLLFHRRWWSAKIAVKLSLSSQKQSALQCAQLVGYVKLFSSNGRNSTADYVDSSTLFVSRPNVCGRVRNNETSGEIHISVAVFWKGHIFHLGIVWWEAAGLKKRKKNTLSGKLIL